MHSYTHSTRNLEIENTLRTQKGLKEQRECGKWIQYLVGILSNSCLFEQRNPENYGKKNFLNKSTSSMNLKFEGLGF